MVPVFDFTRTNVMEESREPKRKDSERLFSLADFAPKSFVTHESPELECIDFH